MVACAVNCKQGEVVACDFVYSLLKKHATADLVEVHRSTYPWTDNLRLSQGTSWYRIRSLNTAMDPVPIRRPVVRREMEAAIRCFISKDIQERLDVFHGEVLFEI
jgi:hypothetical protein